MLQRAATSAYSWWWASHIRTKQSKWLEQNLQDMEEKVQFMLKIIEQEGDSFAKRAEMYYKKRPELISSVEESYRAYRALAERFDHLSKDLQSANRTIATVFPEQVHLGLESDDEDSSVGSTAPSPDRLSGRSMSPVPKNLPKAPKLPKQNSRGQSMLANRREQLRRNLTSPTIASSSGLNKDEATKEVDSLQKDILSMQTEKEFVKSAYESALAKFLELESRITDSQSRVCTLQDEFDIGTSIEDHEARTLMAGSALKSCAEALAKLQDEQGRSMEVVKEEYDRIKEAHERLYALKKLSGQEDGVVSTGVVVSESKTFEETLVNIELEEGANAEAIRDKIREQMKLNSDAVFTEPEMAEKIDDLVEKIVLLETTVCSQNALVKRLRQEIDELLGHIKDLEGQKQPLAENSAMSNRLRELEEELVRVKRLNKEVVDTKNCINAEITEASCNLDHLTAKLQDVKPYEGLECSNFNKEVKAEQDVEEQKEETRNDMDKENFVTISQPQHEIKEEEEEDEEEKPEMFTTTESSIENDTQLEDEGGLNWRQLYMNNLEDREKILVEEYTIILRDYKGMKMKLSEMEKQHRDGIFELASHVKELRNIIAAKDEEIQMLRKQLSDLQAGGQGKSGSLLEADGDFSKLDKQIDIEKTEALDSDNDPHRKPLFHHLYRDDIIIKQTADEKEMNLGIVKEANERRVKLNLPAKTMPESRTEGRFRAELDNLLEANLDFWLRFSTAFHQIQKFQTSIRDLKEELVKLKGSEKKEGIDARQQLGKSDARPLYKHFREIQTELTLWLEHSTVFQEELRSRFASLNNIQDEIIGVSDAEKKQENELSDYQEAKFQGEILNMKQENSKVAEELQAGIHRVKSLKVDIEKALAKLDKEFNFSESKSRHSMKNTSSKPRIPLHSFLFGVRLKKKQKPPTQSFFACVNPTLPKDRGDLPELLEE